jgi:hypothetical protein
MKRLIIFIILFLFACPSWSQEFSASVGSVLNSGSSEKTVGYQYNYLHMLSDHLALGLSYLNEGHFSEHHRDGYYFQLWGKSRSPGKKYSLAAGIGPYFYFDTNERTRQIFNNEHGVGIISSLSGQWYFKSPFFFRVHSNWVWTNSNISTISLLFGLGVELETAPRISRESRFTSGVEKMPGRELSILLGRAVMNNRDEDIAFAGQIMYRERIIRHLEWTLSFINEGHNDVLHRIGGAAQIWAVQDFYDEKLTLGIGLGPYIADHLSGDRLTDTEGVILAGILTVSAAYRFDSRWLMRAAWSRTVTDYDRDSDIILIGPGFCF